MKPRLVYAFLLAGGLLVAGAAEQPPEVPFQTGRISIRYDGNFHLHLRWKADRGGNVIVSDPSAQQVIEVNGRSLSTFAVDRMRCSSRRVTDPQFGPALEGTILGVASDDTRGIRLERRVRLLLPDRFPDVVLFQTSYRNLGKQKIHLGRVDSSRLLLDRSLAEPGEPSYRFATYQGGAYSWGKDYALIWLEPGFHQSNFQGLTDRSGPEGEGGGNPFIDVWGPTMGVAVMQLETKPQWVSLPVRVRKDERVEMALSEKPLDQFKQQEWLAPGENFHTVLSAVIFHHGDFYDPLHTYGELLRARGVAIPITSPKAAYEPYWKSWGFGLKFTTQGILRLLPELDSMDIHIANLDDGWFDWYGDWNPVRTAGKFPRGETDMREVVRKIHAQGFQTAIWWYPIGVSPESKLAREHPELLVQTAEGGYLKDDRGVYQLCPAYAPARDYIAQTLTRFITDWGIDSVYVDSTGLTAVPPCYQKSHHHHSPLDSFESMPLVFQTIRETLDKLRPDSPYEVCICAMPHSPYNMPYYQIATASDPINPMQMRRRVKAEKAIRGPTFDVGDCYQIPLDETPEWETHRTFTDAMGVGAQMTTFYRDLTPEQRKQWQHWFHLYRKMGLSSGEYLNLYDIAFDKPEAHVVRKNGKLYYGFFAGHWPENHRLELRGLRRGVTYAVYDYEHNRSLGSVSGDKPYLTVSFDRDLVIEVAPKQ